MKKENSSTTILLTINIALVIMGLLMINKRILNTDEKSDSLKQKINQIETQLDVLIDDTKTAKQQVVVANKDFIQLVEKRVRIVRTKMDNIKINQ